IGWDLIIEYAIGNIGVAISWAGYFEELIRGIHIGGMSFDIPMWLRRDLQTALQCRDILAAGTGADRIEGGRPLDPPAPHLGGIPIVMNLPAIGIVTLITIVLVVGVKESSWFNAAMVLLKLVILTFFVIVGLSYIKPENWHPFSPNGWGGVQAGAAIIFF